jgi:hypothetical protein
MIADLALAACLVFFAQGAGRFLDGPRWVGRAPAAGVVLWLAALAGVLAAAAGLVALVVFAPPGPGHGLVEGLHRCLGHSHPGMALAMVASAVTVCGVAVATRRAVARLRQTRTARRRHREMLELVAEARHGLDDVCVLDHPLPVAYCLPSGERPIVVSSGTLTALDPDQLSAVLTHERAHLRGRHHALLALVDVLAVLAPWADTIHRARTAVPALLEQVADDRAARRHGPRAVSAALRKLSLLPCPAGGLAAGPASTDALRKRLERLERLDEAAVSAPGVAGRRVAWAGAVVASAIPPAISLAAAMVVALTC